MRGGADSESKILRGTRLTLAACDEPISFFVDQAKGVGKAIQHASLYEQMLPRLAKAPPVYQLGALLAQKISALGYFQLRYAR